MKTDQNSTHIPLTPVLHPWVSDLVKQRDPLQILTDQHGSPLNIHSLIPFTENLKSYQTVFKELGVKHKIYFARKANKCLSFATESVYNGEGVDTASYRELKQCLDAAIPAEDLILTAAVKNERLLNLAVDHQVTVVLDNKDEWDLLKVLVKKKQKKAFVNIRLGGFHFKEELLHSRFGFSLEEAFEFIQHIHFNEPDILYTGLHFHLNGYSVEHRAAAIEQCIKLIDQLKEQNIETRSLDIGGGFLVNYLSDKSEWEIFHRELKRSVLGEREPLTYQNDSLGIIKINNQLYGEPTVYPYYNELNKADFLRVILNSESSLFRKPVFQLIRERNIELRIEPGRSLLDQCGITVAKVAFRKKDKVGNLLVGLEMNRTQLRSSSADFLLDPIHIPRTQNTENDKVYEGYLVGAYCLEQELILKRKITFLQFPHVGDLIVFPNTAGYMMHFFESEAHLFELAKNVFV